METNIDEYLTSNESDSIDVAIKEVIDNDAVQKETKRYDRMPPKEIKPQLPNTIFNAVAKIRRKDFSRKDLRKISNIIKEKYTKQFKNAEPEKIQQNEGDKTFNVYLYPESMRKEIMQIVSWFFNAKDNRAINHKHRISTEILDKLKRNGSPDYEMELVKFNMAEEERRKQGKKEKTNQQQRKNNNQKRTPCNTYNKGGVTKNYNNSSNADNKNKFQTKPNFNKRKFAPDSSRTYTPQKYDGATMSSNDTSNSYIDRILDFAANNTQSSIDVNNE